MPQMLLHQTRRRLASKPGTTRFSRATSSSLYQFRPVARRPQNFGSNDPNDPVDGTVNKTITEWLAAGNKAEWKVDFGLDGPALGDAEDEIDDSGYGTNLFLTRPESKTRGIDPHRRQVLPHRGLFDNSEGILENTISAADNALKHGFHGVEFDLRADKNSHPWMMHDATLGRVTGDPNNCLISEVSSEESRI